MKSYVYCITCAVNNKIYVGKTNNPIKRWKSHQEANSARAGGMLIHAAIKKYGHENFKFEVLLECDSEEIAFSEETKLIRKLNSTDRSKGYNMNEGGRGGVNPTAEVRKKIGLKHRGKKISDEQKAKISAVHKGKVLSLETRQKMSESRTGSKNGRYRRPVSAETRKKISEARLAGIARRAEIKRLSQISEDALRNLQIAVNAGDTDGW